MEKHSNRVLQIQSSTVNKNSTNNPVDEKKEINNQDTKETNYVAANSKYKISLSNQQIYDYLVNIKRINRIKYLINYLLI